MRQTLRQYGAIFMISWIALGWTGFSHFTSTLWVDDDDPTCGGHSPCYQTIQEAVAAAQPGDTIKVRPGTYQGQISISKDLTISGESQELVLIHNKDYRGESPWEAIRVTGPATVTIEKVSVIDSVAGILAKEAQVILRQARLSNTRMAIGIFNGQLTLMESQLSSNGNGVSLATESLLPNRIEGNQFQENAVAIFVGQSSRVIIRENKIYDAVKSDGPKGSGIELGDSAEASIQANTIQNNANGVLVSETSQAYLEGNQIVGNALNGVIVQDSAQALLIKNQISQNGFSSEVLGAFPLFGDQFFLLNTFRPQGFGVAIGLAASVELRQNRVEDNLFGIGVTRASDPTSKQLLIPRLIAQGNYVQGNGWGIWLRGAEATLEGNEIIQNDVSALPLDPQLWYWLDFFSPSAGILIQGGQPLIQSNRIMRNRLGVVLQLQSSPTFLGNQILNNSEYGIALYQHPCFDLLVSNPLIDAMAESLRFQGKVSGEANELSGNGKADLCPPNYPWPPGFRK